MVSDSSATTTSYCSTRGGAKGVSFEDVVLGGLAEDRGLYVPEELPTVSTEELAEVCAPLRGVRRRFEGPFAEVGAVWRGISVPSRLVSWSHVFFAVQRTRFKQRRARHAHIHAYAPHRKTVGKL